MSTSSPLPCQESSTEQPEEKPSYSPAEDPNMTALVVTASETDESTTTEQSEEPTTVTNNNAGDEAKEKKKKKNNQWKRGVSFSDVKLHVHPVIIGKQPALPIEGIPITIAWYKFLSLSFTVDEFEQMRGPARSVKQLKLPPVVREMWLRQVGYTLQQIEYARLLFQEEAEGEEEGNESNSSGRVSDGGRDKPGSTIGLGRSSNPTISKTKIGRNAYFGLLLGRCFGKRPSSSSELTE